VVFESSQDPTTKDHGSLSPFHNRLGPFVIHAAFHRVDTENHKRAVEENKKCDRSVYSDARDLDIRIDEKRRRRQLCCKKHCLKSFDMVLSEPLRLAGCRYSLKPK